MFRFLTNLHTNRVLVSYVPESEWAVIVKNGKDKLIHCQPFYIRGYTQEEFAFLEIAEDFRSFCQDTTKVPLINPVSIA